MTGTPSGVAPPRITAPWLAACLEACLASALIVVASCSAPEAPPELLGGQATIFDATPNAFSQPAPGLDRESELLFFVGNSFFNQNWVVAPSSTTARDGLGPLFNARSCAGCHLKDGRGRPPESAGEVGTGLLVRLSIPSPGEHGGPLAEPTYGGQLADQAIPGVPREGRIRLEYADIEGHFADGAPWSLRRPTVSIVEPAYGELRPDVRFSTRLAPQMIGLGLLEAVPEAEILSREDPDDADGDGISGRPNRVWDETRNATALGRFGWKASQPTVHQQVAGAFLRDMGITTPLFPRNDCGSAQGACADAPTGGEPEISNDDFRKVVLYASSLAVPAMRIPDNPQVVAGYGVFRETGCASCHTQVLHTGEHPSLPALSGQVIYPYTDILLHDMGADLADGREDFEATGSEWRTSPLWGIGLLEIVNLNRYYLHDGRARSLTEAILWHGGEAEEARNRFVELPVDLRSALLRFLEAL